MAKVKELLEIHFESSIAPINGLFHNGPTDLSEIVGLDMLQFTPLGSKYLCCLGENFLAEKQRQVEGRALQIAPFCHPGWENMA